MRYLERIALLRSTSLVPFNTLLRFGSTVSSGILFFNLQRELRFALIGFILLTDRESGMLHCTFSHSRSLSGCSIVCL